VAEDLGAPEVVAAEEGEGGQGGEDEGELEAALPAVPGHGVGLEAALLAGEQEIGQAEEDGGDEGEEVFTDEGREAGEVAEEAGEGGADGEDDEGLGEPRAGGAGLLVGACAVVGAWGWWGGGVGHAGLRRGVGGRVGGRGSAPSLVEMMDEGRWGWQGGPSFWAGLACLRLRAAPL
jgi:hypothetical protein